MEKFLNSFAFEQMAREYNKKYGNKNVEALSILGDDEFVLKVTDIFDNVFNLFELLKKFFGFNNGFKNFFNLVEEVENDIKQCFENLFLRKYYEKDFLNIKNINHKICANKMLDVLKSMFEVEKQFIEKNFLTRHSFENLEKQILDFNYLQSIFEKIIKTFKTFYEQI